MKNIRLTLAAALLIGTALPALAVDTKPVVNPGASTARGATMAPNQSSQMGMQNNAQAGMNDTGANVAPNMQAQSNSNTQTAMNTTQSSGNDNMGISSDPSATQRKGTHLSARQHAKANAAEAQTTRQLNQQAAAEAAPSGSAIR